MASGGAKGERINALALTGHDEGTVNAKEARHGSHPGLVEIGLGRITHRTSVLRAFMKKRCRSVSFTRKEFDNLDDPRAQGDVSNACVAIREFERGIIRGSGFMPDSPAPTGRNGHEAGRRAGFSPPWRRGILGWRASRVMLL